MESRAKPFGLNPNPTKTAKRSSIWINQNHPKPPVTGHLMSNLNSSPLFSLQNLNPKFISSLISLKQIHALIITNGLSCLPSLAHKLFDTMPQRDSSIFNTLIRGYTQNGRYHEPLIIYKQMHSMHLYPDHYTFPFIIRLCGIKSSLREGKITHCNVIKHGFNTNCFVQTALVTMYSQTGEISDSESVFQMMKFRNLIAWTAMISVFSQNCFYHKSLHVFNQMICSGTLPNEITLISVLPSLQGLKYLNLGKMIHGFSIKSGFDSFQTLLNALVAMYGKCGNIELARYLFNEMHVKNLISWNTMIGTYEQNNLADKALKLFREMLREKVRFNCVTLLSVLSACANLGSLETAKFVHYLTRNNGFESDFRISNVLISMYAKCGRIDHAREVFDKIPQRGVISYTTMIHALANHGEPKEALNLFSLMKKQGIKPNSYTYTAVLVACAHSGLINEGLNHFENMRKEYNISPTLEHSTCIVNMLGREGNILEAYDFIKNMDIKPDKGIWGALLGACRIHNRLDLAEFVARDIFELGCNNDVTYYMLLMNMYGDNARWHDVERLRKIMRDMELKKTAGLSFIGVEMK